MSTRQGWHIRPATSEDAEAVTEVILEAGAKGWAYLGEDRVRNAIRGNRHRADLVAEDGGGVIGFTAWQPATGEVVHLFTHPRAWGRGAGRALLEAACDALRDAGRDEAWLYTEQRNAAVGFYRAAGFTERGEPRIRDWHGARLHEPRLARDL